MPLSFNAILGGMTTLIGSSTNLLVSDSLQTYANIKLNFLNFLSWHDYSSIWVYIFNSFSSFLKDRSANELIDNSK